MHLNTGIENILIAHGRNNLLWAKIMLKGHVSPYNSVDFIGDIEGEEENWLLAYASLVYRITNFTMKNLGEFPKKLGLMNR